VNQSVRSTQLLLATISTSSTQAPAPNAQGTLTRQPALLSVLQSASFRDKQYNHHKEAEGKKTIRFFIG
jgi:hypothetical protein